METIDSHIENAPAAPAKSETWKRGLIMLAFMFAFGAGQSILYLIAIGLPHIAIPGTKLEPGRHRPASGLAEAERRADRTLAARSLREPAADIAATNAA